MNELALFAGAGGGILGGKLLGWRTVCAVEWDAYAASVLVARQNDGCLPPFPIWDDVQTFDGKPWRGIVDVVSGGFPCQDISAAGKGAGIDGERSGMWSHMARIIGEVRPRFAFVENSPILTSRGLGRVLGDLAEMGYDARWCVLGAVDAGAPHKRDRIWIVADACRNGICGGRSNNGVNPNVRQSGTGGTDGGRFSQKSKGSMADAKSGGLTMRGRAQGQGRHALRCDLQAETISDANSSGCEQQWRTVATRSQLKTIERGGWWESEPDVGRVANGVAARVDRLKAIGNGQVPAVAALAWRILTEGLEDND